MEPFSGKQVVKKAGGLLESVRKVLPPMPNEVSVSVFRLLSDYSLGWTVKTCESIEGTCGCLYYEFTVYVGRLRNNVLIGFEIGGVNARTDYTADEIEQKRVEFKQAQELADAAKSRLCPFGEYDN